MEKTLLANNIAAAWAVDRELIDIGCARARARARARGRAGARGRTRGQATGRKWPGIEKSLLMLQLFRRYCIITYATIIQEMLCY